MGDPIVNSGLMAIKLLAKKEINNCSKEELKKISDELIEHHLTFAWLKDMAAFSALSVKIRP